MRGELFSGGTIGGYNVGGLVGYQSGGNTQNCYTVGEVIGNENIGGLTGNLNGGTITKCYSNSYVTAFTLGGGLVGYNKGSITSCYAIGNIETWGICAGGLVGVQEQGSIQNCFASVKIDDLTATKGGLVGRLAGGSVVSSFFDLSVNSGINAAAEVSGGLTIYVSGKTTEEMMRRNTYSGWTFDTNNWGIYADGCGYPYLASIHNYTLVTPTGGGSKVYDGIEVTPSLDYTCSDYYDESKPFTGSISFAAIKNPGESTPSIGTLYSPFYQVRLNHNVKYIITKATPEITISATPASPRVIGTEVALIVTLKGVTGAEALNGTLEIKNGTLTIATYAVNTSSATVNLNWNSATQNIGINSITAVYSGDSNYNAAIAELPYQILDVTTIIFPNQTVEYSGDPVDVIEKATAIGSSGAITYQFYKDFLCLEPIPAPVDAGTYYCKATVEPDENYAGASMVSLITIQPKASSDANITIAGIDTGYYFTGNPIAPVPTIVTGSGVTLAEGTDYALSYENNTDIGTATVTISFKGNYSGTAARTFSIAYAPNDSGLYAVSGGVDGWTNQDIVIIGVGGSTLCLTPTGTYANSLTITEEADSASGTNFTFYVKDLEGIIHECTVTYKLDKTSPTGKITLGTNVWNSFLNTITFGLFFKETKTVSITADSDLSGATVAYYKSETPIAAEDIASVSGWVSGASFNINPNEKCFIYAKITDGAGNVTYLDTDGIVVYTDSAQADDSVAFIKISETDVTARVALNGNTIKEITRNGAALTPGTDYTVSGDTITFKASYLKTLPAGVHTLIIGYNPLGETYEDAPGNQAPSTTSIDVIVLKANVMPQIVVTPSSQSRPNKVTLSVIGLEGATGTIQFIANNGEIATVPVGGTADFYAQGSVDTYEFVAVYSGDENYNSAISAATTFTFSKGSQNPLVIAPVSAKTYGDSDFALSATGGSGTGEVTFTVTSGTDVISINGSTVKILKAGTATVVATKAGDDDYNPITSDPVTITVEKANPASVAISASTDKITYGDSFTFKASGGSGAGAYVWSIVNEKNISGESAPAGSIATIDPSTGLVTAKGVGSFTVQVVRVGDENYHDSAAAAVEVAVEKRTLTIAANSGQFKYLGAADPVFAYGYSGAVGGETPAFTGSLTREAGEGIGSYAIRLGSLVLADNDAFKAENYAINFVSADFEIKYLTVSERAVLDTPNGSSGWFKDNAAVRLTAPAGFQISLDGANWSGSVVLDNTDGTDKTAEYYLKRTSDGAQTDKLLSDSYKVDNTAPTGKITLGTNVWNSFLNTITFGLFFKETQTIIITADSDLSGIASIEYYRSDKAVEQIENITEWTAYAGEISVAPNDAESFVYYVKITDNAGNVTYLSTDGAVFDLTAPEIGGVVDGETYYTTQVITVDETNLKSLTVNGEAYMGEIARSSNAIFSVLSGNQQANVVTLPGDRDAAYVIVATDKAGNTTTVTVYMKAIQSLAAPIQGLTTENVTENDAAAIESVKNAVLAVKTDAATDEEKAKLQSIIDTCGELLAKIQEQLDTSEPTESSEPAESSEPDNVDTGDRTQPILLIAFMAISALGFCASLKKRRKGSL